MTGGCGLGEWAHNGFKVGPNYHTPPAPVAVSWIDYQRPEGSTTQPSADVDQWWRSFDDPVLNSLVSDMYAQNLTLRAAGERIAQARAARGIAVGNLFPQAQSLTGSYDAVKASNETANGAREQYYGNAQASFNVSWELDFWGRYRRAIESADASLDASIADFDDVLVVLVADVASNYVQYRTLQERLDLTYQNVKIQEDSYRLATDNFKTGRTTERDMQQARQVLEQTRAAIPVFEIQLRQTNDALCVLLGIPSQKLADHLGETGTIPVSRPNWDIGIPADLLRRRPDVRRAEREAAAQSAVIGIAQSELYPHFTLDGSIGVAAEHLPSLGHTPDSVAAFGGPAFEWNILNYGRLANAVEVQKARFRELVYRYQETVLRANAEAENALIRHAKSKQRADYLAISVSAAQRTVQITYDQYHQGVIDFTPVFLFEGTLTTQQDELAQAQGDIAQSLIDLYRALGGGWQAQSYAAPHAPPPTTQHATSARPTTLGSTTGP